MSGSHGLNRLLSRELRTHVGNFFHYHFDCIVGIRPQPDHILFVLLEQHSGSWEIVSVVTEERHSSFAGSRTAGQWTADELIDIIDMGLKRYGWQDYPIAISIPATDMFGYLVRMPRIDDDEQRRYALHCEMDGHLRHDGIDIDLCQTAELTLDDTSGTAWLAAIPRLLLDGISEGCRNDGLDLLDIEAIPPLAELYSGPDMEALPLGSGVLHIAGHTVSYMADHVVQEQREGVLYAVWAAVPKQGRWTKLSFIPQSRLPCDSLDYRRIALLMVGICLASLTILAAHDAWGLYESRQDMLQSESQLAELASDRKRCELWEQVRVRSEKKEQLISQLADHQQPWYALLVHLGTVTVDGVWLDSVETGDDDDVRLTGQATDYASLTAYVEQLEHDEFFADGVTLESSSRPEQYKGTTGGTLSFRLHVKI